MDKLHSIKTSIDYPRSTTEVRRDLMGKLAKRALAEGMTITQLIQLRDQEKERILEKFQKLNTGSITVVSSNKLSIQISNGPFQCTVIKDNPQVKHLHFGGDFEKFSFAEKYKVRKIAFSHFDRFKS